MSVFKIPESLSAKYQGSGYALAAVAGGQVIDIVYLRDVLPGAIKESVPFDPELLNDKRLGPAVRRLQALGEVFVGMCSSWEFIEL